jgi:N-acyl-D-aspartate/D-glutamate deacylase
MVFIPPNNAVMSSTYHIHADELDENFLASLKALYKGRVLEISVEAEADETERITSNPATKARLDAALAHVESGNYYTFTPENFERYSEALQRDESPDVADFATLPHLSHEAETLEGVA